MIFLDFWPGCFSVGVGAVVSTSIWSNSATGGAGSTAVSTGSGRAFVSMAWSGAWSSISESGSGSDSLGGGLNVFNRSYGVFPHRENQRFFWFGFHHRISVRGLWRGFHRARRGWARQGIFTAPRASVSSSVSIGVMDFSKQGGAPPVPSVGAIPPWIPTWDSGSAVACCSAAPADGASWAWMKTCSAEVEDSLQLAEKLGLKIS
jgi:hypothetical protein